LYWLFLSTRRRHDIVELKKNHRNHSKKLDELSSDFNSSVGCDVKQS
jgi:hypothetical protein